MDKTGVLKSLGSAYVSGYNGFNLPVETSKWASWAPKTAKLKVGVAFGPLINGSQTTMYDHLVASLKASPKVSSVVAYAAPSPSVTAELQQYNSLVQQHVNLIVYEPEVATAFIGPVKAAGLAGIPSVAINAYVDSPYSVNATPNSYLFGAKGGAALFALMKGKGSVLQVNGLVATTLNITADQGFSDALKLCPGIHVLGPVTGGFSPSMAESATLSFLSSHPVPLGGVWEAGVMSGGVVNAFNKLGRTVPPVSGSIPPQGFLAYWASRTSAGYRGYMATQSPGTLGTVGADVAIKMLKGDDIRVNNVVLNPTPITSGNLSSWVTTKNTQSDAASNGPPTTTTQALAYVAKLFRK